MFRQLGTCQEFLEFSVSFEVRKSVIEHLDQFWICSFLTAKAVSPIEFQRLAFSLLPMADRIFENWLIVHHGINRSSIQTVIHRSAVCKGFNLIAVFALIFSKEGLRSSSVFNTDSFILEVFIRSDRA